MAEAASGAQQTATGGSSEPPPSPIRLLAPGSDLADRYEIRSVLGHGGYAVVYLAWDRLLRREVALKVLRADRLGDSAMTRFRREAAIAREVESPHLVRIFDLGQSGQTVYLTMERVEGESLRDRLQRGSMPIETVIDIARQVAEGLACLHRLDIVHRDVKPGNILITDRGVAKVADFGLARRLNSDETRTTGDMALLGTVEYLSPEQALGKAIDSRSDLYSFGVVLFEMLTGQLPHSAESSLGTVLARLSERVPDPRRLRPDIPSWLSRLVRRLLAKRPDDRFATADDVLATLRARRSMPGRRMVLWSAAAAVSLAILPLAMLVPHRQAPTHFHHLVEVSEKVGLRAIGSSGETLWTLPDVDSTRAMVRMGAGKPLRIASLLMKPNGYTTSSGQVLSLLDSETGKVVQRAAITSSASFFPGFADTYVHGIEALDLDGDGIDEVLVTFYHLYWPSFTVLYEPRTQRMRTVLVASGHHRPVGLVDVDGDGHPAILFAGISNRMGHYFALAAVKPIPPVNQDVDAVGSDAFTPDPFLLQWPRSPALVWYALLPPNACAAKECIAIDRARRRIEVSHAGKPAVELGLDGFVVADGSRLTTELRQGARNEAYASLREGSRLLDAGFADQALEKVNAAVAAAGTAGDHVLLDWARRCQVRALLAAGHPEWEGRLTAFHAESLVPADVAYEAAEQLHLSGRLEDAVVWYRHAFESDPSEGAGQQREEVLLGLVLALGELGRWDEAVRDIERFSSSLPSGEWRRAFEAYLEWRQGRHPSPPALVSASTEFLRYWNLEIRLQNDESAATLFAETEKALARASDAPFLFRGLEGELLLRMGRVDDAAKAARQAYDGAVAQLPTNLFARSHLDLLAARLARVLSRQGEQASADELLRDVRTLLAPKGPGRLAAGTARARVPGATNRP